MEKNEAFTDHGSAEAPVFNAVIRGSNILSSRFTRHSLSLQTVGTINLTIPRIR